MELKEFSVETWMTDHEQDCKFNLADTCVSALTINELAQLIDVDLLSKIGQVCLDYGPITGSSHLKQAILSLYKNGDEDNIAITHGAINANQHVMDTILSPGDHVIAMTPSYEQFYTYPASLGCSYTLISLKEENQWKPTIDDFKDAIKKETKMIILNSPNNPTGTVIDEALMSSLIDLARAHDCYIMVDEIYKGLSEKTPTRVCDLYEKGIVTNGLSKIFGFAGLRLGWVKANKELIKKINFRRDYTIISSGAFSDMMSTEILEHTSPILKRSRDIVKINKQILSSWLEKEDLVTCVIPEDGTVCFLHYHLPVDSKTLCEDLQEKTGVFFVPGSCFDKEYHLRFGFTQDPHIIEDGLALLSSYLHAFQ